MTMPISAPSSSSSTNATPRTRRELFERTAAPPPIPCTIEQCSLRKDNDEASLRVGVRANTAINVRTLDQCSCTTLERFRAHDKDRQKRLRALYDTLRKEWSLPHQHEHPGGGQVEPSDAWGKEETSWSAEQRSDASTSTASSSGSSSSSSASAGTGSTSVYPAPYTAEEKRVESLRKEYLKELYHSLCPGDDAKGKGPSLERFVQFVETKEEALWKLFCEIDRDNDMRLGPAELQHALANADIKISLENLAEMVKEMDKTGTGHVTFEEWRDFLLLLPRPTSMPNIWTYWKSHSRQPRLATSMANQDLDVILAEKPSPPASTSSFSSAAASASASTAQTSRSAASAPSSDHSGAVKREEDPRNEDHGSAPQQHDEQEEEGQGIFEGSAAYLIAGGLAGAVSRTATAPFDRLKVYLINTVDRSGAQLPGVGKTVTHPVAAAKDVAKTSQRGMGAFAAAVKDLYAQGGLKAFFVGNGLNIIKIVPESACKFWSYEYAKRWFARNVDHCGVADISGSSRFIAGGFGGITSQLLIYPLETWKTRVMSSTSSTGLKGNALYLKTAQEMFKRGGVRAYYSGLSMGLIGVAPYSATDMFLFSFFKKSYMDWAHTDEEPGVLGSLTFGALSGGLGATSVYPLNLLRTRMQTQGTPAHPQRYTGWRDVATKCYQKEGIKGFYKGLSPTLLKVSPAMAISWSAYQLCVSALDAGEHQGHDETQEE